MNIILTHEDQRDLHYEVECILLDVPEEIEL